MATGGLVPLFTSAPRLRLYINQSPTAYAIGFNCNIAVDVQPVQIIGQFAAVSLEPVLYNVVTGTLQIIKLVSKTTQSGQSALIAANDAKNPAGLDLVGGTASAVATQDTLGKAVLTQAQSVQSLAQNDSNSLLSQQQLAAHLDPNKVLLSRTFDMDLYLTVPVASSVLDAQAKPTAVNQTALTLTSWFRIKYCRLTSRNTNIAAGQLVNEPCNFQGLLATPMVNNAEAFGLDTGVKDSF